MSKKTLVKEKRKIVSERKRASFVLLGCFLVLLGVFGFEIAKNMTVIGNKNYQLEIMDSEEERITGLSRRQKLERKVGMLFVFDDVSKQCMWMKDMNFSLDIVWLDNDGKIIAIEENIEPKTYPKSFCYDNAKYVIELNSGEVKKADIRIGQIVKL